MTENPGFESTINKLTEEELVKDDQLRMMFACCHPEINEDSQASLILKILCGFSTAEISKAFLTNEETITKRLFRAKEFFSENKIKMEIPSAKELKWKLNNVLRTIYLILNEGYNSTEHEELIRKDLIEEAYHLSYLLSQNQYTNLPEVHALLALISFHASRVDSRQNELGNIQLLEKQNRKLWNQSLIGLGKDHLNLSARGEMSIYHLEAAIAYEHCKARNFEQTNWEKIHSYYELLLQIKPSPVVALNKAIVIAELFGPRQGLMEISNMEGKKELENYYLYYSVIGELYLRLYENEEAIRAFQRAISLTRSKMEIDLLNEKIKLINSINYEGL